MKSKVPKMDHADLFRALDFDQKIIFGRASRGKQFIIYNPWKELFDRRDLAPILSL